MAYRKNNVPTLITLRHAHTRPYALIHGMSIVDGPDKGKWHLAEATVNDCAALGAAMREVLCAMASDDSEFYTTPSCTRGGRHTLRVDPFCWKV